MALGTKKRESRKSLHQSGWITLDGGFAARPCVVQDMSTTGAKITIDDPNTLPAKLKLAFSRDAKRRDAKIPACDHGPGADSRSGAGRRTIRPSEIRQSRSHSQGAAAEA